MLRKICFLALAGIFLLGACARGVPLPPAIHPTETEASPTASNATPAPIVLVDGLGRTVKLAAPARQIVSLAPSNTEILFAIGAGAQVIGRDQNSDYPAQAKSLTNIGGSDVGDQLNTELILSLKPDLVLAGDITPPEQIKNLEDLGLTVFTLKNPTTLDGMYDNLRNVAQLTGHQTQAEMLIASLQTRVKTIEEKVAQAQQKPLVFYELDGTDTNAPWTSGPGTFIDTLITMAGGRNVGADLKTQWAQMSLEQLTKDNPDTIVLGDSVWGGVTPALVEQRPGWEGIAAVKNGRIFPIDDNLVSRPGPRLIDGLEALAKLLHPQIFK